MVWREDNDVDFLIGLAKKKWHLPKLCISVEHKSEHKSGSGLEISYFE
jgi:hypothetical protein